MQKILTSLFLLFSIVIQAQHTKIVNDELANYKKAKDLYNNGNFSLAYPLFKDLENSLRSTDKANQTIPSQDIEYYTTVCGLIQNDTNAVYAAQRYIDVEPNNPRTQMLNYFLGNYHFGQQRFTTAIVHYEATAIENLSNAEIATMKFNLGYSYFTQQEFVKAKPLFNTIRQLESSPKYLDANYYYGFICYYDKQYSPALESFKKVETHETYGAVVPFYITQILYLTGKQDKALEYAEAMLKKSVGYYDLETRQLVGHAYFEKRQFAKALPYLEKYVAESNKVRREDIYELSFCYYEEKRWAKAIEGFKQLSGKEDSLSQNSMYLLGDAYLKVNQKANARSAFAYCAANSSNEKQREVAKFNYAKLSYELGYIDVALKEGKDFLNEFPKSTFANEARELLVAMLTKTNNFREAQEEIEQLSNPSEATKKLYPRILYGRATEYINDQNYNTADVLLNKILLDKNNTSVLPFTNFWKGEIAFRNGDMDNAITYLTKYVDATNVSDATRGEVNANNAKYTLGYAYLKKENYNRALGYFDAVSKTAASSTNIIEQDAYIKTADCYFMNKEFAKSIVMYDVSINKNWVSADYATYQKAMATGATNTGAKIDLLKTIERKFASSNLINDANVEIATAYMADLKYSNAIPFLNTVLTTPGDASLKPKALLNLGISYSGMNNDTEALTQYKKLIKEYPNSEEADDALENIEKLYIEQGNATDYADFMRNNGKPISVSREDSLTYIAAEKLFNNNDVDNALKGFQNYLTKFANGAFALNANFYSAEILNGKKDFANATLYYEQVAAKGASKFAERATNQAARINYFELKNYEKSELLFAQLRVLAAGQDVKLDALRGLLRSQYYQQKYVQAAVNAKELIANKLANTDDKVLSNLVLAKTAQIEKNYVEAIAKYKNVVTLNKAGFAAEARYEIASCLYAQNKLAEAEKAAFEVVNKSGSYEQWLTKAYLLLGDIYYTQKDYFNAKATFQSVYDNATITELKAEAKTKLDNVIADEKANSKIGQ